MTQEEICTFHLMSPEPITIASTSMVKRARDLMQESNIRHLPVVDDGETLVGILSERDVLRAHELNRDLNLPVSDVMSTDIVAVRPKSAAWQTTALMLNLKIGAVAVVEAGKLVGIVTDTDCVRVAHHALGGRDSGLSAEMSAGVMGSLSLLTAVTEA